MWPHLSRRWFAWRNRTLADPRFQRWAGAFPLTRWIAQRRASALFDLTAGFVYSQILYAAVRSDLFGHLTDGPKSVEALARDLSLPKDGARRLLDATCALKLTELRGAEVYGLGIHGAALVGNASVQRMIEHHAMFYRDLADPLALLRGEARDTELSRFWSYGGTGSEAAEYSALMTSTQAMIAEDIVEAYPFGHHRHLLDVGGGEGAFLCAVGEKVRGLSLSLFDLPPVAERARVRCAGEHRSIAVHGGDVFRDPLPEGCDLISLVRVIHDHDEDRALAILRAVHRALPPKGTLLIAEPMSETRGAEAIGDAYFGFYLLAMGRGRPRTAEKICALLTRAGFGRPKILRTRRPMLVRAISAQAISIG